MLLPESIIEAVLEFLTATMAGGALVAIAWVWVWL